MFQWFLNTPLGWAILNTLQYERILLYLHLIFSRLGNNRFNMLLLKANSGKARHIRVLSLKPKKV